MKKHDTGKSIPSTPSNAPVASALTDDVVKHLEQSGFTVIGRPRRRIVEFDASKITPERIKQTAAKLKSERAARNENMRKGVRFLNKDGTTDVNSQRAWEKGFIDADKQNEEYLSSRESRRFSEFGDAISTRLKRAELLIKSAFKEISSEAELTAVLTDALAEKQFYATLTRIGTASVNPPAKPARTQGSADSLKLHDHWRLALEERGVPEELQSRLVEKFRLEVARATRPKWVERFDQPKLGALTAPAFLKEVHAAEIGADGSVSSEVIRAIDDRLMQAVELYVGQRRRANGGDMGDAEGLNLVHKRKPRTSPGEALGPK